jgi:hygromycin-B 4-O-kinase
LNQTPPIRLDLSQVQAFLQQHFDPTSNTVEEIGAGAWSRCYAFRTRQHDLVVRFGAYDDDFAQDERAMRYAVPGLPVPHVFAHGTAFDGYYAISTRVYGSPLEEVPATEWRQLVPAVADLFEALRSADLSASTGWGGSNRDGNASSPSWAHFLLMVGDDTPAQRTHGWRARLIDHPHGEEMFAWGYQLLQQLLIDQIPRNLIHCDLLNRNVFVRENNISGVFDWGCTTYGDHLYELAWFDFWAPWHPNLNTASLHTELRQRWKLCGYTPANLDQRLLVCYLHIGLNHLAYNAYTGDQINFAGTAERMRQLAGVRPV